MNDDIEILDIFDEDKRKVNNEPVKKVIPKVNPEPPKDKKKVKRKLKAKAWQVVFCGLSFLFILGCCIFYGLRFIKYYRIYNPKVESGDGSVLLAKDIIGKTEYSIDGDAGLFSSSGNYVYKGKVNNNYLRFNNMTWRIVKINIDNSLDIVLDDYIGILPWNKSVTSFKNSEMYEYLNKEFIKNIDKSLLVPISFCEDEINDLSKITCDKLNNDSYVRLLDVTSFLNSVKNKETYLTSEDEIFWLTDNSSEKVWHTNGSNVSQSDANVFYEIRPVVKLKNTVTYTTGDGTKDNPYIVGQDDKIKLGSIVMLGEDKWYVYSIDDDVKLMRAETLEKQLSFDKEKYTFDVESKSSLAEYLNTEYLDSLSYKNMLINTTWYTGSYKDSLNDIKTDTVKAKVGIPNLLDIKFDSSVKSYFTSTSNGEYVYVYENPLRPSRNTTYRSIRPCVAISKSDADKLKYDNGVFKVEG